MEKVENLEKQGIIDDERRKRVVKLFKIRNESSKWAFDKFGEERFCSNLSLTWNLSKEEKYWRVVEGWCPICDSRISSIDTFSMGFKTFCEGISWVLNKSSRLLVRRARREVMSSLKEKGVDEDSLKQEMSVVRKICRANKGEIPIVCPEDVSHRLIFDVATLSLRKANEGEFPNYFKYLRILVESGKWTPSFGGWSRDSKLFKRFYGE